MGILNSIGRGLSSAGYTGAEIYGKQALEDQRAQIQADRDARLEEMAAKGEIRRDAIQATAEQRQSATRTAENIGTENRGILNATQNRAIIHSETVARAPELRQIKIDDAKEIAKAEYDPEIQAMKVKAETGMATAKEIAKIKVFNDNFTTMVRQEAALARAKHIDDGAALRNIQIDAARLSLDEQKKVRDLIVESETSKDPERVAAIRNSLITRGILKPSADGTDTQKVTTEEMTPTGTRKTEFTQKRPQGQIGGANETPGPWNIYKNGAPQTTPDQSPEKRVFGTDSLSIKQLEKIAARPKGVSVQEAKDAQAQIENIKKNPDRMSAF
jgi:hypothetical protein